MSVEQAVFAPLAENTLQSGDFRIPMQTPAWMIARSRLDYVGTPHVLNVEKDGQSRATAMLCTTRFGLREMPLMNEPSDFTWSDETSLHELLARFTAPRKPFYLERLPENSPTLPALKRAAQGKFWVVVRPAPTTPYINTRGRDIQELVKPRRRSDLRRAFRRLSKNGEVSFEICVPSSKQDLDRLIDDAFDVETRSWKHDVGTALTSVAENPYAKAFRGFLEMAFDEGHIRFAFIRLDGKAVAMQIASEWQDRYWVYKATYDKAYAKASPGNLLYLYTLEWAAQQNLLSYEFMGNMEDWTRAWTQTTRSYVTVLGLPYNLRGVLGAAVATRWQVRKWLEQRRRNRNVTR